MGNTFELDRKNCPMRADNGNCLPVGGFCTAVADIYCEIAHKSYGQGFLDNTHRVVKCVDCVSRIPAKDPDCCVCNNPKSPCYQREIRNSDLCQFAEDGEQE